MDYKTFETQVLDEVRKRGEVNAPFCIDTIREDFQNQYSVEDAATHVELNTAYWDGTFFSMCDYNWGAFVEAE